MAAPFLCSHRQQSTIDPSKTKGQISRAYLHKMREGIRFVPLIMAALSLVGCSMIEQNRREARRKEDWDKFMAQEKQSDPKSNPFMKQANDPVNKQVDCSSIEYGKSGQRQEISKVVSEAISESARERTRANSLEPKQALKAIQTAYGKLNALNQKLIHLENNYNCPSVRDILFKNRKYTFNQEFDYVQQEEQRLLLARETAEQEREQQRLAEIQKREDWKKQTEKEAKKLGYKGVLFDVGIYRFLTEAIAGNVSVRDLSKIVIEMNDEMDSRFVVLQYLGKGSALYHHPHTDIIILLRGYDEVLLEGSSLMALNSSYIVIKGVESYSTLLGRRQAFVAKIAL